MIIYYDDNRIKENIKNKKKKRKHEIIKII